MTTRRSDLLAAAVADNLRWCSSVCDTEPIVGVDGVWVTNGAPHPLFPDLVTARAGVSSVEVAERLAGRSSCTVKDSFADLDLESAGFTRLFDARWIGRGPVAPPSTTTDAWTRVTSADDLVQWSHAAALPVPLPSHVLDAPGTTVVVRHDNASPVSGFVATEAGGIVGVSNVWDASPSTAWPSVIDALCALFPGRSPVGYEHGADLDAALRAGFRSLGPLRVWSREP